jgi:hypothetical protein
VTQQPPKQSAAATAAEKVRAIVEAAERSATELEQAARDDAARIRAEAEREVESRLGRAREAAARLAERAEELERQVAAIRTAIDSLGVELEELRAGSDPHATAAGAGRAVASPPDALREGEPVASVSAADEDEVDETIATAEAVSAREPDVSDSATGAPRDPSGAERASGAPQHPGGAEPASATRAPQNTGGAEQASGAGEGARVIALNMALSGASREQTARYLAENFQLDDPDALLDDVYARAGR